MNRYTSLLFCLALVLLQGCSNSEQSPSPKVQINPKQQMLHNLVEYSIVPTVIAFKQQANDFQYQANLFCNNLGEQELQNLQSSWRQLYRNWYRLANYNFGPLNDDVLFPKYPLIDSMRENGRVYTDTVRGDVKDMLGNQQALNNTYFDQKPSNRVGLTALEVLIFESTEAGHPSNATAIMQDFQSKPRKCEILNGLAKHLFEQASYVEQGWLQQGKDSQHNYQTLFLNNQLKDGTDNLATLMTSVQNFLDYMQQRNVAQRAAVLSGESWQAISDAIKEMEKLLKGTEASKPSIFDIMRNQGATQAVVLIESNIQDIHKAIHARDAEQLAANMGKLDGNFKREIPKSLGVTLGLNFSDGD